MKYYNGFFFLNRGSFLCQDGRTSPHVESQDRQYCFFFLSKGSFLCHHSKTSSHVESNSRNRMQYMLTETQVRRNEKPYGQRKRELMEALSILK